MERLSIPSKLKIQKLIERYPIDYIKGFHKDKVYFICDSLYNGMRKLREDNRYNDYKNEFCIPLYSKILKSVLGRQYKEILEWMEKTGIISTDGQYSVDNYSKGYRFTKDYLACNETLIRVTNWSMQKRKPVIVEKTGENMHGIAGKHLEKWLNDKHLHVNIDGARNRAKSLVQEKFGDISGYRGSEYQQKLIESKQYYRRLMAPLEDIKYNRLQCTPGEKGYRLFTSITSIKRELRQFVTYGGSALGEVDIKNSQFYFLTYLLNWKNWKKKRTLGIETTLIYSII